jgi:hypothetical protein
MKVGQLIAELEKWPRDAGVGVAVSFGNQSMLVGIESVSPSVHWNSAKLTLAIDDLSRVFGDAAEEPAPGRPPSGARR